jgi:hypothetical protein
MYVKNVVPKCVNLSHLLYQGIPDVTDSIQVIGSDLLLNVAGVCCAMD